MNRRDFVDKILERKKQIEYNGKIYTVVLIIDPQCEELIADMQWVKEGIDGKFKELEKDKETGMKFEKYGHCFVGETKINTNKGEVRIDEIKKGDMVLTRNGYKKVTNVFDNGIQPVQKYHLNGIEIICTKNHKIFTLNKGFIKVCDVIRKDIICILDKNKESWKYQALRKQSMETNLSFIKKNSIIKDGVKSKEKMSRLRRTGMFGISTMEKYLKVFMYIIRMKINQIIKSKTSNYSTLKNIQKSIFLKKGLKKLLRTLENLPNLKQWNGTVPKMELIGIENTLIEHSSMSQKNLIAKNVEMNLKVLSSPMLNFAPTDARTLINPQLPEKREDTTKKGFVSFVKKNMRSTNGLKQKHVGENVEEFHKDRIIQRRVFDIEVEDEHEYFANGILVHNCSDALEYLLVELLDEYYP